jgi:hypothetical protein
MDALVKAKQDLRVLLTALGHQLEKKCSRVGNRYTFECEHCGKQWALTVHEATRGARSRQVNLPQLGERCHGFSLAQNEAIERRIQQNISRLQGDLRYLQP